MARKKKEVVYLIDCPNCDSFDAETWTEVEAHIDLVHATVYAKACRGDYHSKVPYVRYSEDKVAYDAHQTDQYRLNQLFRHDLEEEHGVQDNPKKHKLFDIAWSQGHSFGFSEVALHYDELVELIK